MQRVATAVLGGGQGTRLWPLTQERAKPAVPVGGKFRLIDIPISNSLHAGINHIYVLTQFNSASLHRHIAQTYRFDVFSSGFVAILAAEQSLKNRDWYQGTADAVRQNIHRLTESQPDEILVLSGDQLYLMDMRAFLAFHRERDADLTIAVKPVSREEAKGFGIMRLGPKGRILEFVEKPQTDEVLEALTPFPETMKRLGFDAPEGYLLASMGMYAFKSGVLQEVLANTEATDFGREIIPAAIEGRDVYAFPYNGYWSDIGTLASFHQANLQLTLPLPPLDLYSARYPIFTHPRFLPGTKIHQCQVSHSILCEGSIISGSEIARSIIGIRALVRPGSVIDSSIVMGATHFETMGAKESEGVLGIGRDCEIRNAIIDLNASIGDGSRLLNLDGVESFDGDGFFIREGIIVVPRGGVVPAGTVV